MLRQSSPIRHGVGNEEDDDRDACVARFQADPSIDGLNVDEPRLCLDPDHDPTEATVAVPRPEVTLDGDRNLGSPGDRTW